MATDKPGNVGGKSGQRLGRGLDALLRNAVVTAPTTEPPITPQPTTAAAAPPESALREIPIKQIRANPFQPRSEFSPEELKELQASIKMNGLLQPISVRKSKNGVGFELIAGERRLRAVINLGWAEIPAIIKDVDDKSSLTLALIENLQRSDLNPVEEGEGYLRLQDEFGLTQPQIAELVGKDRSTVANLIRILNLPPTVRQMLESRSLTLGHARPLMAVSDETVIIKLANEAVTEGLSVRAVENRVRQAVASAPSTAPAVPKRGRPMKAPASTATVPVLNNTMTTLPVKSAQVLYIEDKARKHLQTDVTIKLTGPEKGELVVQFYSTDDLERVLEEMGIELYTDNT